MGILPDEADFDAQVQRVTEDWGPATGTDDRTVRSGRGHRMAVWNNRVVSLWMMSSQTEDGTWQTHFSLRLEGVD
jgi:hypothetical protein